MSEMRIGVLRNVVIGDLEVDRLPAEVQNFAQW